MDLSIKNSTEFENVSELLEVVLDPNQNDIMGISIDGDGIGLELSKEAFEAFLKFMEEAENSDESLMFNFEDGVTTPVDISILTEMTSE